MKTSAVRLYGPSDIRLESFELPPVGPKEVLLRIVSDTLCASTYKAVKQGSGHKRVPEDIAEHPIIIGHEMCGVIEEVGSEVKDLWQVGECVVIQPALKLENGYDPGYSYHYIGGDSTYSVVPSIVLERNCMVAYQGEGFYKGSLVESLGCCLRGFKGMYHNDPETCERTDGTRPGGRIAILGGAGPMGIGMVELAIGYAGASQVLVTDLSDERLASAAKRVSPKRAAEHGVRLDYVNTGKIEDPVEALRALSDGGFDDVFVMVPVPALLTMAEEICREDGCINFFAGPALHQLPGSLNLYRVHYDGIHMLGTAGSTPEDTKDIIRLMEKGILDPSSMVSHICGLGAVIDGVFAMEHPSGAKRVCYTGLDLPMVAIEELEELGKKDPLFAALAEITQRNEGLWSPEAEAYLLKHGKKWEVNA